jgi:hypothetical protein
MSYFLFPEIHYNINNINIKGNDEPIADYKLSVSLSLNSYLTTVKQHINDNCDTWDHIKKYTNPY